MANETLDREKLHFEDETHNFIAELFYECIDRNSSYNENATEEYCSKYFDGWLCWNDTPANTVATQPCPDYVAGFDSKRFAHKTCLNGTWFTHPESGKIWSNYTLCLNNEEYEFRRLVNRLFIGGYSISLIALMLSLTIFQIFRSLKCTRIRIHIHLFSSLALSCLFWIIWYLFVVSDPDVTMNNKLWCICLHLVIHYLMLTSYFWMFCEGLHLHLVLVVVFVKDVIAMRWFLLIGWMLPMFIIFLYGFLRAQNQLDSMHCWMDESPFMWILIVPVCITLLTSLIFLINVIRVLLTKHHPRSVTPAPLGFIKAARATVILIPLFGLQHLLLPFRPAFNSPFEHPYQIVSAVLISSQGFCVSCLFCFANHDIIFAIKCYLYRWFPNVYPSTFRESNIGQQPVTLSKDVNV